MSPTHEPTLLSRSPLLALGLLGAPLALAAVFQFAFNLTEVWIFGQIGDGGASLAGAAASDVVTGIFALLANGLGNAAVAQIAFYHGAGDRVREERHARQALVIGLALSLGAVVVGLLADPIGSVVMAEGEPRVQGTAFLRIMALGGFGTIFIAIGIAVLRARGDSVRPLIVVAVMSVATIGLEAVFVLGLFGVDPGGVVAAAWITVILRGLAAVALVALIARQISLRPPEGEGFIHRAALRGQLHLGLTSAVQQSVRLVGFLILLGIVSARFGGDEGNSAYTAINVWIKLDLPTIILAFAWGGGTAPIVGMALGSGRPHYARRAAWSGVIYGGGTALVTMTIMLLASAALAGAFVPDDPDAVAAVATLYDYAAPAYVFFAVGIVIAMAYNGAGDMRTPLIWDTAIILVVQTSLAWVLADPEGSGLDGLGLAILGSGILQGLVPVWLLRNAHWHREPARRLGR